MQEKKINVVHLNVVNQYYYTGIDRYIEEYELIASQNPYCDTICVHKILLINKQDVLFPVIEVINDSVSATIPMPVKRLLFEKAFWKKRFFRVVSDLLIPYLSGKENIIFQYHNLYLLALAETLREVFGGKVLAHLHCLAWKYNYTSDHQKFKQLYKLYYTEKYDDFRKLEDTEIKYETEDSIICVSDVAKRYIVNVFHTDEKSINVIPNGMQTKQPKGKLKRKNDANEILYVGKVAKDKGIFELLSALGNVKHQGIDFTLKIAGTISPHIKHQISEKYGYLKIDILGQIPFEKLEELYMTCSIGVIPSLFEQCSYVAIEMAMYGLPMIVSDVDALSEMFEHEKNVLLTPLVFDEDFGLSANQGKFVENLSRLLTDKKLREYLSLNVQKLYEEKFTLEHMITETVKIYNQLTEQKNA